MGPNQNLALEGYAEKLICRKRHKKAKSSSGGLVIYIKTEIKQGVTIIPNKSSEYGWMKLAKNFFKTNEDIYLCFAYANPDGSQHRTETGILDQIKQDLAMYKNLGRCILMADLNGYTNTLPDYNTFDNCSHNLPLPDNYICDTPMNRRNLDSRALNVRGKDILEFSKASGLKIVNGRKIGDIMGKFTCYDPNADTPSVIDYALADRELFNEISYFRVKDFTTFSDHCPIELKINADYTIKKHFNKTLELSELPAKFIWDNNETAALFRNALNTTAARESINTFRI